MKKHYIVMAALAASACAKNTNEIPSAYTSPLTYQSYDCGQIGGELARVSRRAQDVAYGVDKQAEDDAVNMGVGLILFWPSLFFIDGDTPQAQEYARLKGDYDALEQAGIQKKCGLNQPNPFLEIEKRKAEQKAKMEQEKGAYPSSPRR